MVFGYENNLIPDSIDLTQWAVQGPFIIDASLQMGVTLGKSIMALTYGDQITNMLPPFWALPLLGTTGLKA